MQTGTDSITQQLELGPCIPERVPEETTGESGCSGESVQHKSAFFGMRLALPLALSLWGMIAALIWACRS